VPPGALELVTKAENTRRRHERGRMAPPLDLTPTEQAEYQRLFTQRLQDQAGGLVGDASWSRMNANDRERALQQQIQAAGEYATQQIYSRISLAERQRRMQKVPQVVEGDVRSPLDASGQAQPSSSEEWDNNRVSDSSYEGQTAHAGQ
jgi:hypothetical protein